MMWWEKYGAEITQIFFLCRSPNVEDGPATMELIKQSYNAHLANGLGNLVSRVMKMAQDNLEKPVEIQEK